MFQCSSPALSKARHNDACFGQFCQTTLETLTFRGEMRNNERHGLGQLLDHNGNILKYRRSSSADTRVFAPAVQMINTPACSFTHDRMQGTWSEDRFVDSHEVPRQLLADVITVSALNL